MSRLNDIKLFLLDMDGTIYLGESLFPCTVPFLQKLEEIGTEHLFLTNNSSKDKKSYIEKLTRMGIAADERHIITSGDVTIEFVKQKYPDKGIYLVGTGALKRSFLEAGLRVEQKYEDADLAVVGFDTSLNYDKLSGLYRIVKSNRPYICTHPDLVCPTEDGEIPDIGAVIAYIYALTGRKPDYVLGKPERYMIEAASKRFNIPKENIAMVGDRLYTDIEMAKRVSVISILVLTGETSSEDIDSSITVPDYVFSDLSELIAFL